MRLMSQCDVLEILSTTQIKIILKFIYDELMSSVNSSNLHYSSYEDYMPCRPRS